MEIEALKSCASKLKCSVSKLKSKLDSVMNSLSMISPLSGMDPELIPGTAPIASYVQITRNSMSLRMHGPRDQIRQQSAKPSESQDRKSNLVIFEVEKRDSSTNWIRRSLSDVGSVKSILPSIDDNIINHSVIDC